MHSKMIYLSTQRALYYIRSRRSFSKDETVEIKVDAIRNFSSVALIGIYWYGAARQKKNKEVT